MDPRSPSAIHPHCVAACPRERAQEFLQTHKKLAKRHGPRRERGGGRGARAGERAGGQGRTKRAGGQGRGQGAWALGRVFGTGPLAGHRIFALHLFAEHPSQRFVRDAGGSGSLRSGRLRVFSCENAGVVQGNALRTHVRFPCAQSCSIFRAFSEEIFSFHDSAACTAHARSRRDPFPSCVCALVCFDLGSVRVYVRER